MSKDEWKKVTKNEWKKWVSVVGRMLLAYALVFAQGAWAGQNQGTHDKAASPQKAAAQQANERQLAVPARAKGQAEQARGEESESAVAEEKPSNDASHQGIKVHGHWTIEVRNPDGALVTHREFENAYQPGYNVLPGMLSRVYTMGSWAIEFNGSGCNSNASSCDITEPGSGLVGHSNTLSVTEVGGGGAHVVLSGNIQMTTAVQITSVWTFLGQCVTATIPSVSACASSVPYTQNGQFPATFTMADLSSKPIPIAAGQTVQVTVDISFS